MDDDYEIMEDGFIYGASFIREKSPRATCANCIYNVLHQGECDYCADYDPHDPTDAKPFRDVLDWEVVDGKVVRRVK